MSLRRGSMQFHELAKRIHAVFWQYVWAAHENSVLVFKYQPQMRSLILCCRSNCLMRPLTPASENLVPLNHLKTNINLPNGPGRALSAVSVCNDSFCGRGVRRNRGNYTANTSNSEPRPWPSVVRIKHSFIANINQWIFSFSFPFIFENSKFASTLLEIISVVAYKYVAWVHACLNYI